MCATHRHVRVAHESKRISKTPRRSRYPVGPIWFNNNNRLSKKNNMKTSIANTKHIVSLVSSAVSRFHGGLKLAVVIAILFTGSANANNPFPWGWCTYGAAAEFDKYAPAPGCDWSGDAGSWIVNAKAKKWVIRTDLGAAEEHALIVWTNGIMGHVASVYSVYSDHITVKEMNWGKQVPGAASGWTDAAGKYTYRDLKFSDNLSSPTFKFAGFIMPRHVTSTVPVNTLNQMAFNDIKERAATDGHFWPVSGTVNFYANFDPNYQGRWMNVMWGWYQPTTIWQITNVNDPALRYTTFFNPDTRSWAVWQKAK